ncbi:mitochondrial carrier domain-containing protein [Fimicolochytrium jonesii]|uniref:mitochondrial carrier domain-containing protein n=1 Tax=Fimicolochytrium jonesii TaxID=1396493 RepID=UPI0022FEC4C5|nr:mitochondrial carrier domain-containing protein [Fimicolochytrium jonesii]KAI8822093.1 mitochondrial carrier domain-containing protein [Fimicolochytrium jonesii]
MSTPTAPAAHATTFQQPQTVAGQDAVAQNDQEATGPLPVAGVMAGVAKSVATKSAFAATAMGKGLMKWWFRFPIKLFRPHTINPWTVVNHMAAAHGQKAGVAYMRVVAAEEGFGVLGRNIIPLLLANACAGAVLFNVYASATYALSNQEESTTSLSAALAFDHAHPFIAGAMAGASTSIISTPIDNVKARITPADIVAHRHEGMLKFTYRTCQAALKDDKTFWAKCRRLYKGIGFLALKDAAGFGLFFFFFENIRRFGKGFVADRWNLNDESERVATLTPLEQAAKRRSWAVTIANATAVIFAGATAGAAYQAVIYPLDNIPTVMESVRGAGQPQGAPTPSLTKAATESIAPLLDDGFHSANATGAAQQTRYQWSEVWQVVRQKGIRPFYAGIAPQLLRVMPPSALGLFAYEVASSQFWDNDET